MYSRFILQLEHARLRLHFMAVLAELRASPVPVGLSQASRERTIGQLREYARAGRFPLHGGRGKPRPVFADQTGTHCAVAHLLARDGRDSLVREIARTRNFAHIRELVSVPGVGASLEGLGITPREAARIQPTYTVDAPGPCHVVLLLQFAALALVIGPVLLYHGVLPGYRRHAMLAGAERGKGAPPRIVAATILGLLLGALAFPALNPWMTRGGCGYAWDARAWLDAMVAYDVGM